MVQLWDLTVNSKWGNTPVDEAGSDDVRERAN